MPASAAVKAYTPNRIMTKIEANLVNNPNINNVPANREAIAGSISPWLPESDAPNDDGASVPDSEKYPAATIKPPIRHLINNIIAPYLLMPGASEAKQKFKTARFEGVST